ncbi:MAG TPA: sugar ABC transporter ATP-binding protein [Vicinamibacteria bacterium]|nr:sugar ABC transporter ATP-binding protein [Vicinamibacteria bacterium]
MAMLSVRGLSKSFGGVRALADVSLDVARGEVLALVGENGAGKSTLIRILSGAHALDAGTVTVDGQEVAHLSPQRAKALGIAVIYQQPALLPDLSVAENLALGDEPGGLLRRLAWPARRRRAASLLARLGLAIDPDRPARTLSMPEKQLCEIARALGADARVLVLDEPTASLSVTEVETLLGLLRGLRAQGLAIVYVSHRLEEVFAIADRVTVLRDGAVVETRAARDLDRTTLIRLMVGRELAAEAPRTPGTPGALALEAKRISSRAAGVHDVSLVLRAGEVVGLFGLVNSGRTELARVLAGLTPADAGELRVGDAPVALRSPGHAAALGIAHVPEDRRQHGVVLPMSVAANCSLSVLPRITRRGLLDRGSEDVLARAWVDRLQVKTASLESEVATLSGGNQQKVALARALATGPRVLILDEPTQGVDVGAKAEIHARVAELAAQGLAVLVISSDVPELLTLADRVAVMCDGTIVAMLGRAQATPERMLALALGAPAEARAV